MESKTMNGFKNSRSRKFITIIVIFLIYQGCSGDSLGTEQNVINPSSKQPSAKGLSYVECNGIIHPGKRFILRLGSGERVSQLFVSQGQIVKKDTPLVMLSNFELQQQIRAFEEMEFSLWKQKEEIDLLKIEIENEETSKKELEELITKERNIGKKIPGYQAETQIRLWKEQLSRVYGQLRLLNKKRDVNVQIYSERMKSMTAHKTALADLTRRYDNLNVLAPFDGAVIKCHESAEIAGTGELVLELWDESFHLVHAYLLQNQIVNVSPGNLVEIYPDFYQNSFLTGIVQSLSPADTIVEDNQFPKFPVLVQIQGENHHLIVGMAVSLKIYTGGAAEEATGH